MKLHQENNDSKGRFYSEDNLAEITYSTKTDVITILHTEVHASLKGKGIGNQLVGAVVAYARESNQKIRPLCSFAKAVMNKKEDYQDVLLKDKV